MQIFLRIISSGAVVNFFLVILGSVIGLLFGKIIPKKLTNAFMTGMALCVFLIGVDGILIDGVNIIIVIVSMIIGTVIGELIDLDALINKLGLSLENEFAKKGKNVAVAQGFSAATLLFCVGAMTIVGSISSGLSGDNATLYSKSVIDCISAIVLTTTMGFGVLFSCLSVLLIEGSITLLAVFASQVLTNDIIIHMSCVGSLLIVALSLNMLGITKIKVVNFVPAIFVPILLCQFI